MTEDALFDLAHGREKESLWQTLQRRRGENPDFARCHESLSNWLAKADFMPPFEFFTSLLVDADGHGRSGRERLVARLGTEANDPIDEFLSLSLSFEQAHTPSLEAFLHWLEAAPVAIKRDMEQGRDEVRIMTVHGAKGLQAPIVFLPDTCQTPDRGPRLLWVDDPLPPRKSLMIWPGKSENEVGPCADARALYNRRREEEYLRLLYVALTRAEDRLYVCGWDTTRTRPEGCWFNLIAAAMDRMEGAVQAESEAGDIIRFRIPQTAPVEVKEAAALVTGGQDLPGWARRPRPEEPLPPRPLAPSAPMEMEPATRSPLVAATRNSEDKKRFARGRLVHALLERLPELAPEARTDAARRFLSAPVHDLDTVAVDALIRETFSVLDHPDFAPLFGPGSRAEVPLAGV
ncbi:MAG TPA: 3'-5' exonuclease, partial [Desulfurivibrionaceae bacterium]|nr:3'-5' exonuclease [Desulfurivibrionaceae bacterium]